MQGSMHLGHHPLTTRQHSSRALGSTPHLLPPQQQQQRHLAQSSRFRSRPQQRSVLRASSSDTSSSSPPASSSSAPASDQSSSAPASTSSSSSSQASDSTAPPHAAAATPAVSSKLTTDWEARRKQRVVNDLVDASKRLGPAFTRDAIQSGVAQLESLLPGLQIDIELLKASDWAKLVVNISDTANKIILLKTLYPRADLTQVVQRAPATLLWSAQELQDNAVQVKQLLADARDPDVLLTNLPSLLEPRTLISVLVTVRKWYFNKRDPVEVLESDPDLVRRAQECDMPWEPVYEGPDGQLMAPSLDYHNKRTDWQAYIDRTFYKQE